MKTKEIFCERFKELRIRQEKTQMELSREIHIDQSTLSKLQSGKRDPSMDVVVKVADRFCTSTDYLLGRTNDPNPAVLIGEEKADSFSARPIAYYFSLLEKEDQDAIEEMIISYTQCRLQHTSKYWE